MKTQVTEFKVVWFCGNVLSLAWQSAITARLDRRSSSVASSLPQLPPCIIHPSYYTNYHYLKGGYDFKKKKKPRTKLVLPELFLITL